MISLKSMRFLLALLALLLLSTPRVFAQEASSSPDFFVTPPPVFVEYPLPYPGILPDNPLYSVKMLRDKIVLFLITDPYKRAKFNLLQADKRLQAGAYLLNEHTKKDALALSTIEKGENYFSQALQQVTQMKKNGHDIGSLLGDLKLSAAKHHEVLTAMKKDFPSQQQTFSLLLKRVESYQQQISRLEKN